MQNILIVNASQILTMSGTNGTPLTGAKLRKLKIRSHHAIIVKNGIVSKVIPDERISELKIGNFRVIDANGSVVMPGLIDSHTHIVFGGDRSEEFYMRIKGKSYLDILSSGNGIYKTVNDTRMMGEDEIFRETYHRVAESIANGTTAMEMKTGYGLDLDTEMKMLRIIRRIALTGLIDVVPTFLPLHAIPHGKTETQYMDYVVEHMLPKIGRDVKFVDSFCDRGVFSEQSTDTFFSEAVRRGYGLRLHADELADIGCLMLCEKYRIKSVDHLIMTDRRGTERILHSGSFATFLPITAFNIADGKYPNIRSFIDVGIPIAIASDISPLSTNSNLFFAVYLAVRFGGISVEEALNAVTINAAYSLDLADMMGSIERGKKADIIILNVDDYRKIPYEYGNRLVKTVIKSGDVLLEDGCPTELMNVHNSS